MENAGTYAGSTLFKLLSFSLKLSLVTALVHVAPSAHARGHSPISFGQAVVDAQKVAAMEENWVVMRAKGNSMAPHFTEHALLLVDKAPYSALKKGMIAVYKGEEGEMISHLVTEQTPQGWKAQGANNFREDPNKVTADNFVGIVFGVFDAHSQPLLLTEIEQIKSLPIAYGKAY